MNVHGLYDNKDKENEDSDEDKQEYYAGGAGPHGGSGMNVLAPNNNEGRGAEGGPEAFLRRMFEAAQQGAPPPGAEELNQEIVTITMYSNGFTLNDGEFRDASVAENTEFIKSLSEGKLYIVLVTVYHSLCILFQYTPAFI